MKQLTNISTELVLKAARLVRKIVPPKLFEALTSPYHFFLAWLGSIVYGHPSREIKVVGVTGTKGKSSVVEITNAMLEGTGHTTAVSGTVQFKIAGKTEENKLKQTMPGRFFLQRMMRQAVDAGCEWFVLESTSEGAKQHRNRFIEYDCLIFTNLAPEHIEAHGSYEKYRDAKLSIARNSLVKSKKPSTLIANGDDKETPHFLALDVDTKITFSLQDLVALDVKQVGIDFEYQGVPFSSPLTGEFNVRNLLAVIKFGEAFGIALPDMADALKDFGHIPGRVQRVNVSHKQDFEVVVDYAHTPDSLEAIYKTFEHAQDRICILGNTGGGRDQWKRPVMAKLAEQYCDQIILTNEDPYDEDPLAILEQMREVIINTPYEIVFDRRNAIFAAVEKAKKGDAVLITGKGTDAFIMGPKGTRIPWSDSGIAEEALRKRYGN